MRLIKNEDELEFTAEYDSKGEYKKRVDNKRFRLSIKVLEKGNMLKSNLDEDNLKVWIKCNDKKIYDQIIKGFQSVNHLR